jgi:hypothetical protein
MTSSNQDSTCFAEERPALVEVELTGRQRTARIEIL